MTRRRFGIFIEVRVVSLRDFRIAKDVFDICPRRKMTRPSAAVAQHCSAIVGALARARKLLSRVFLIWNEDIQEVFASTSHAPPSNAPPAGCAEARANASVRFNTNRLRYSCWSKLFPCLVCLLISYLVPLKETPLGRCNLRSNQYMTNRVFVMHLVERRSHCTRRC